MTDTDFNPLNWYWQIGADAQNIHALEAVILLMLPKQRSTPMHRRAPPFHTASSIYADDPESRSLLTSVGANPM